MSALVRRVRRPFEWVVVVVEEEVTGEARRDLVLIKDNFKLRHQRVPTQANKQARPVTRRVATRLALAICSNKLYSFLLHTLQLLARNNNIRLVRIFKHPFALIHPNFLVPSFHDRGQIFPHLRCFFSGQDSHIALAAGAIHNNVLSRWKRSNESLFLRRLKGLLVSGRVERLAPEAQAVLRRALFISLDAISDLSNPLRRLSSTLSQMS